VSQELLLSKDLARKDAEIIRQLSAERSELSAQLQLLKSQQGLLQQREEQFKNVMEELERVKVTEGCYIFHGF
jgi:prefoldin subunit 5